jgi:hypothetical protein
MQRTPQGRPRTQTPPPARGLANEGVRGSRVPMEWHRGRTGVLDS